jgi:CO/xanthine dehydrogenase Mo-binding subunit
MAAAEELGIPLGDITVVPHDSDVVPWAWGYLGSRVLSSAVEATYRAAQDVKAQCVEVAAEKLDCDIEDLEFREGRVASKTFPEKSLTLAQIGRFKVREQQSSAAIIGRGIDERPTVYTLAIDHPTHYGHSVSATYYDTTAVEVEVDPGTGQIRILDVVVADDCGRVIDRLSIEGQVDGATVQGIGAGLLEERVYDLKTGRLANPDFDDYHLPLSVNMPAEIKKIFIESNEPSFCYGHKGGGESPGIATVVAAIANAVHQATGVRLTTFPMTPDRMLEALANRDPSAADGCGGS